MGNYIFYILLGIDINYYDSQSMTLNKYNNLWPDQIDPSSIILIDKEYALKYVEFNVYRYA